MYMCESSPGYHTSLCGNHIPFFNSCLSDEIIDPYDLTLTSMCNVDQKRWAEKVHAQLKNKNQLDEISKTFFDTALLYARVRIPEVHQNGNLQ